LVFVAGRFHAANSLGMVEDVPFLSHHHELLVRFGLEFLEFDGEVVVGSQNCVVAFPDLVEGLFRALLEQLVKFLKLLFGLLQLHFIGFEDCLDLFDFFGPLDDDDVDFIRDPDVGLEDPPQFQFGLLKQGVPLLEVFVIFALLLVEKDCLLDL
jgi:hypothetical protein